MKNSIFGKFTSLSRHNEFKANQWALIPTKNDNNGKVMIRNLEDAVQLCMESGKPHRLLYLFVKFSPIDMQTTKQIFPNNRDGFNGNYVQVAYSTHQIAHKDVTFHALANFANQQVKSWDAVIVSLNMNEDGSIPSETQADKCLSIMKQNFMSGDINGLMVFDKAGDPLQVLDNSIIKGVGKHTIH